MADCISFKDLEKSMALLKSKTLSEVSDPKLAAAYARVIDGFVPFCRQSVSGSVFPKDVVAHYYEHVTKARPYDKPKTVYLRTLARQVFIIRDTLEGRPPSKKYSYAVREIPIVYADDIQFYKNWMIENNCSQGTVQTRIGRIKQFLLEIHGTGNRGLATLTSDTLVKFIAGLNGKYSSTGKSNSVYTIRNYFACPYIKSQLTFDASPFLTNLHTNKRERLRSCYTPDEIQRVMHSLYAPFGTGVL